MSAKECLVSSRLLPAAGWGCGAAPSTLLNRLDSTTRLGWLGSARLGCSATATASRQNKQQNRHNTTTATNREKTGE